MKKFSRMGSFMLAASMLVTVALSGCGDNNSADNSSTANSTSQVSTATSAPAADPNVKWDTSKKSKIVFSTIKNYYTTALQEVAKDYTALHPETQVEIEIIGDNDTYLQNFKTKMTADKSTAPDIIHTNLLGEDEGALINKGWLLPLDDLLNETNQYNDNQLVKDAFSDPTYLSMAVSSAGKTSHLPFDLVGVGVFYNKTIFDKVGVKAPTTYEEWVEVCKKLSDAGYQTPIGATAFNVWIQQSLADWGYRKHATELAVLPGDARYDEKTMADNANIKYDAANPAFDMKLILDAEKRLSFALNQDYNNAINKKIFETFKSVAQYFPANWQTPDDGQAFSQFMAQKTPMIISGSWVVGQTLGEMSKLSDDKKFQWGTFLFPKFGTADSNFEGDPRGLLVAGHKMGIADKGDADLALRAQDFLKYMYSPTVASKIYDTTIKNNEYVQGPSLIKGVTLSDDINAYLDGFKVKGNMRADYVDFVNYTNKSDQPKADADISSYIKGKITFEQLAEKLNVYKKNRIEEDKKNNGYDLDSKTADQAPTK